MSFNKTNVASDNVPHTDCPSNSLSAAAVANLEVCANVQCKGSRAL